jgi:hypothetical protein
MVNMIPIYLLLLIPVLVSIVFKSTLGLWGLLPTLFLSSNLFFFGSNLLVWLGMDEFYPRTVSGLLECYSQAIPFYGYQIMGDCFYSVALLLAYYRFSPYTMKDSKLALA